MPLRSKKLQAGIALLVITLVVLLAHKPVAPLRPSVTEKPGYSLGIVEFGDDGRARDPGQVASVLTLIEEKQRTQPVLIITFVHGWNNDCAECNENLTCFQEMLEHAATLRTIVGPTQKRAVVGVYVGWRGQVLRPVWLNKALSFWNRLATAKRLGTVGELRTFLMNLRSLRRRHTEGLPSLLLITAHSLGAAAVFTSLKPLYEAELQNVDGHASFGEETILINPALSASEYELIDRLAQQRYAHDEDDHDPDLVIAGSEADAVTSQIYPLSFIFDRARMLFRGPKPTTYTTITNYHPFVTHELRVISGQPATENRAAKPCTCPFPTPPHYKLWETAGPKPSIDYLLALTDYENIELPIRSPTLRLELKHTGVRRGPYMTIRIDKNIVPSHNDFYRPELREFIIRLMNKKFSE